MKITKKYILVCVCFYCIDMCYMLLSSSLSQKKCLKKKVKKNKRYTKNTKKYIFVCFCIYIYSQNQI